jgi:hypothetical protein
MVREVEFHAVGLVVRRAFQGLENGEMLGMNERARLSHAKGGER